MRTRTTAACAALLLAVLTACSSNSEPGPMLSATLEYASPSPSASVAPESPAGDDAALEKAVRAYSEAYFEPDAKAAYGMLSEHCRRKSGAESRYAAAVEEAAAHYGHQEIKSLWVDQSSGGVARVSYAYPVPLLNQSGQQWVREDGEWRYDAC